MYPGPSAWRSARYFHSSSSGDSSFGMVLDAFTNFFKMSYFAAMYESFLSHASAISGRFRWSSTALTVREIDRGPRFPHLGLSDAPVRNRKVLFGFYSGIAVFLCEDVRQPIHIYMGGGEYVLLY